MWRNRYDDLWLWPMPKWFIWICNKTIGVYVLDVFLAMAVLSIVATVVDYFTYWRWLSYAAYILIAPVPLLMVMILGTAQYYRLFPEPRVDPRPEAERENTSDADTSDTEA